MAYPLRFVVAALATAVLCGGIARASSHVRISVSDLDSRVLPRHRDGQPQ